MDVPDFRKHNFLQIESPSGETLSDDSLKLLRHFNDTQHNSVKYRKARKYSPMKVSKPNLEHLLMDVFNVPRNERESCLSCNNIHSALKKCIKFELVWVKKL